VIRRSPDAQAVAGSLGALLGRARKPVGVALIVDGEVAWSHVAGAAAGARFQAGSISKSLAACTALELAHRQGIDLDADVSELLRSWQLPESPAVTLRQLLGHTAGVNVPFFPGYRQGSQIPSLRQVLQGEPPARTPPVRADRARSGRFCYSGGGYVVVQQLIADVSGTSFAEAARTLVLEPLGMSSSTFDEPLPDALHSSAARSDWHIYPEAAAAGLWTTPHDLARFACTLQAAALGRPSPLHTGTASNMLTRHAALPAKGEWNLLPLLGVRPPDAGGLGMFLHGSDRFSCAGSAQSFFAMFTGSLADGTGGVVMVAANASTYPFRVLRAVSGQYAWSNFSLPWWRRPVGLPGLRRLA